MGLLKWLGFDGAPEKEPVSLDDNNFRAEVLGSKEPVLVDIWSHGCAPCSALVPTIKRLAAKYDGQIKVAEINAASAPKSVARMGVRGTPTVIFFKGGREVERVVGLRGQHYYEEIIEAELRPLTKSEPVEAVR